MAWVDGELSLIKLLADSDYLNFRVLSFAGQPMKHLRFWTPLALLITAIIATEARASILAVYSGTFNTRSGPDGLGLNGARFTFSAEFDCNAIYFQRFGLPSIDSTSHGLSITGSGGANGTWFEADQIGFYPTFPGQFFGGGPNNGNAFFDIGSVDLFIGNLITAVSGVLVGDLIDVSDFGTTLTGGTHFFGTDGTNYIVSDFSASITDSCNSVVPEPTSLLVWLATGSLGAVGLAFRRKR